MSFSRRLFTLPPCGRLPVVEGALAKATMTTSEVSRCRITSVSLMDQWGRRTNNILEAIKNLEFLEEVESDPTKKVAFHDRLASLRLQLKDELNSL